MINEHLGAVAQVENRSVKDVMMVDADAQKSWADIMSDEDIPAAEMKRLSVGEKEGYPKAKVTPKRRRPPSPPFDELDSDSSDLEFQVALARQKRRVNREVAILKEMVEEDESRQARRLDKKKRIDQKLNEALWFVAKTVKEDAEKGGVKTHQSSPQ